MCSSNCMVIRKLSQKTIVTQYVRGFGALCAMRTKLGVEPCQGMLISSCDKATMIPRLEKDRCSSNGVKIESQNWMLKKLDGN